MNREEMTTVLQIVLLLLGIKELFEAKVSYGQQKKKWAIASVCMGVFACACAIISFTGIV